MTSSGFTPYEIYENKELSRCSRTDTERLGREIFLVGVPSGPIPGGVLVTVGGSAAGT